MNGYFSMKLGACGADNRSYDPLYISKFFIIQRVPFWLTQPYPPKDDFIYEQLIRIYKSAKK